jgi:hypothetical protein
MIAIIGLRKAHGQECVDRGCLLSPCHDTRFPALVAATACSEIETVNMLRAADFERHKVCATPLPFQRTVCQISLEGA